MTKYNKLYKQARRVRNSKTMRFSKRSLAAKKGWITRTRKEGTRKLTNTVLGLACGPINKAKTIKDVVVSTIKVIKPDLYMKSRILKKLDKL